MRGVAPLLRMHHDDALTSQRAALAPRPPAALNGRAARIRAVNELAARQDGCVEYSQLIELGLSRWAIGRWEASGMLAAASRHVYSVGQPPNHLAGRVRRARMTAPDHAVISHGLACEWMDLCPATDADLEFLVARGRPRRQPGVIVHSTTHLPPSDIRTTFGVRHTSAARSIFDVAATSTAGELDRLLDRAAKLATLELVDLHRVVDERKRLPGRPALLAAVARLGDSMGRSRSELERRAIALCVEAGIGEPISNGIRAGEEVDLSWLWTNGVVELDGFEFHWTPAQVAAAARKLEVLRSAGVPVLHLSWFDVTQRAQTTAERVRAFTGLHRFTTT